MNVLETVFPLVELTAVAAIAASLLLLVVL
jgi:hypothetical protein